MRMVMRRYNVSSAQARGDYTQFCLQLGELIRPDGACPVHELGLDVTLPFSARPAPALPHGPCHYLPLQR